MDNKLDWKKFERFVAEIFLSNSFLVRHNLRFRIKRRYEIDLLALRGENVFCIDCKSWSMGRYKKTALQKAATLQEERTSQFKKYVWKNFILQKFLKINPKSKFHSLIVTLVEEEILQANNTFFVPVSKLNSFLVELESYL